MWLISAKKTYNCFICAKPFRGPSALKHYFKIHIDVRAFSCNLCPISFASKTQLDNHIRMYTGNKAFLCNSYGHCFITRGQLELHKMNRHAGVRQFGNCENCFTPGAGLRQHFKCHTARSWRINCFGWAVVLIMVPFLNIHERNVNS